MVTSKTVRVALVGSLFFALVQGRAESPHSSVMNRFVVVGDSLGAGFQNFSLFDSQSIPNSPPGGQRYGYASVVAKQADTALTLPLISLPGIPPVLVLTPTGQIVRGTVTGVRENPAEQPTNLSVPGFRVSDAMAYGVPGDPTHNPIDALADVTLAYPSAVRGCGPIPAALVPPGFSPGSPVVVSEVICAAALQPTAILVSLGNVDVSQAVTAGIFPTSAAVFAQQYAQVVGALAATGAQLILANVADVTEIPLLVPVPAFVQMCPTTVLPPGVTAADFIVPDISNPTMTTFNVCTNFAVRPAALIAATRAAVNAYNVVIGAVARQTGAVVVDIHGLFEHLQNGVVIGGRFLTTAFLGGLFSLDGVHPTNTGYAIMANETIKAMNTQLHVGIPPVSLNQVAADDPLVPPKGRN